MKTISALFLKIDGILGCYNPRRLQAGLAFQAYVSNSGWFDGKHQRIHLTSETKKERFLSRFSVLVIEFRRRTFSRQKLVQNGNECLYEKEW